jgi:integrase
MAKQRRGHNEGSIRWIEKKQLWQARYPIGVKEKIDKDGKPYAITAHKSIYGKKNEKGKLIAKMQNALAALGKGEYVDPSGKSLITWCSEWYETHKKPAIRTNTKEKYLTSIARLKRYDIANIQLKTLTLELIQKFYNTLSEEEGLSEETIRATHSLINGALEKAEELKMVIKNEARKAIIPKNSILLEEDESEAKALTEKLEKAFLYQLGRRSKHFMYALFMDNTGLRPGEALALIRSDVDIKKRTVKVTKTYLGLPQRLPDFQKADNWGQTF